MYLVTKLLCKHVSKQLWILLVVIVVGVDDCLMMVAFWKAVGIHFTWTLSLVAHSHCMKFPRVWWVYKECSAGLALRPSSWKNFRDCIPTQPSSWAPTLKTWLKVL